MATGRGSGMDGSRSPGSLKTAIEALPDKQRIVFNLRYFEVGLSADVRDSGHVGWVVESQLSSRCEED